MGWADMLDRHEQDDVIAIAGDWHGKAWWAKQKIEQCADNGVSLIIHAGDFGVWSGKLGKRYLHEVSKACQARDVDMAVVLGNHEDWARMEALWANPKRQDEQGRPVPIELVDRVFVLPRVWRFELNNVSFLGFGGAASVNFDRMREGHNWWPAEMISEAQVSEAVEGGYADVMVSHESPDAPYAIPQVDRMLASNPFDFSPVGLQYSALSRRRLTEVFEAVKPRVLYHGHMHVAGQKQSQLDPSYSSLVIGVSEEQTASNLVRLELAQYRSKESA